MTHSSLRDEGGQVCHSPRRSLLCTFHVACDCNRGFSPSTRQTWGRASPPSPASSGFPGAPGPRPVCNFCRWLASAAFPHTRGAWPSPHLHLSSQSLGQNSPQEVQPGKARARTFLPRTSCHQQGYNVYRSTMIYSRPSLSTARSCLKNTLTD